MRNDDWIRDAENYIDDINGLFAVGIHGTDFAQQRLIVRDESLRGGLQLGVEVGEEDFVSERVAIYPGTGPLANQFVVIARMSQINEQGDTGYLVCFFESETFFASTIESGENLPAYVVETKSGRALAGGYPDYRPETLASQLSIDSRGATWILTVFPAKSFAVTELGLRLSTLGLWAAIVVSILLYGIVAFARRGYMAQMLRTDEDIRLANEELQTLVYIISHDLKEPLRSINAFAEILSDDYKNELAEEGQDLLGRIRKSIARMERLLGDVSTISQAQQLKSPNVKVNLADVLQEQIDGLENRIESLGAVVTVAEDLPTVLGDPVWIGRAVENLLGNALKFGREGVPPEIRVKSYKGEQGVGFVVQDRGVGLPEETDDRIFELFRRGVSRKVEGTGVGPRSSGKSLKSTAGRPGSKTERQAALPFI